MAKKVRSIDIRPKIAKLSRCAKYTDSFANDVHDLMIWDDVLEVALPSKYNYIPPLVVFAKWIKLYPYLQDRIKEANTIWIMRRVSELEELTKPGWVANHIDAVDSITGKPLFIGDLKQKIAQASHDQKVRIDSLKEATRTLPSLITNRWERQGSKKVEANQYIIEVTDFRSDKKEKGKLIEGEVSK